MNFPERVDCADIAGFITVRYLAGENKVAHLFTHPGLLAGLAAKSAHKKTPPKDGVF